MAIVKTDDKHYKAIANTLRERLGTDDVYTPEEMANGVNEIYEAGKQAEYNAFWDSYQQKGKRRTYTYAFYRAGWTDAVYKPKYPIKIGATDSYATQVYSYSAITDTLVDIDLSLRTTEAGTIFYYAEGLKTIHNIIIHNKLNFKNTFYRCDALEKLTITGVMGQNDFSVQWSTKLTHDSLMNIIKALEDKSEDTSGTEWKVTIGATNIAKLTTEELNIADAKGWLVV